VEIPEGIGRFSRTGHAPALPPTPPIR
jgi:hypothetical protein